MTAEWRIASGHALMRAGLAVRALSAPLAVAAAAALLAVQLAGAPSPGAWQSLLIAAGTFAVGRLLAMGFGGAGWLFLPRPHRSMLVRVALGELPPHAVGIERAAKLDIL